MKTKTFKNTDTIWTVVVAALALLLIVALFVGVFGKTKAEYIPAPSTASPDFSGEMLSSYDNLTLELSKNYFSFNFGDICLSDYDFIVRDVIDACIKPNDLYYDISFGLEFDTNGEKLFFENISSVNSNDYSEDSGPFFDDFIRDQSITYVLDLRDIQDGNVFWATYVDGVFHNSGSVSSVSKDTTLQKFKIVYASENTQNPSSEAYDSYSIGGIYLYGFEEASDCTIGDYIEDQTLNLSTCKDSMLYTGE